MAEAWDAAGLYQVGSFVGDAWKEWNGRFRDDVRSFFRGEDGMVGRFADRIVGSPELYAHKEREPEQSVNFVTCHDGFTLNDLVSYDGKHNEAQRREQPRRRRRQPELELRGRRPDRRSRRRAAAQPPGEELPDDDAAVARAAHDPDGRRGAAHAARQQQPVLPRRRARLARLDAARAAPGRASVRQRCSTRGGCGATSTTSSSA